VGDDAAWTPASRRCFERWLTACAARAGLEGWTLVVDWDDPAPEDAYAQVSPVPGQRTAVLQLGPAFSGLPPAAQRETVAHELVHCHLAPVLEMARRTVSVALRGPAVRVADQSLEQVSEYATDGLARVLAELLPEPDPRIPHGPDDHPPRPRLEVR
jgi:hypothetical protein